VCEPGGVVFRGGLAGAETGVVSGRVEHRTPIFNSSAWPESYTHKEAASLNASGRQRENFIVIMPTTCSRECAWVAVW